MWNKTRLEVSETRLKVNVTQGLVAMLFYDGYDTIGSGPNLVQTEQMHRILFIFTTILVI